MTKKQTDVLLCLLHGFTVKQTAARLGISTKTVSYHENAIFHKLKDEHDINLIKFIRSSQLGALIARIYFQSTIDDRT